MDNRVEERLLKMGMAKSQNVAGGRRKQKVSRPIINSRLSEDEKNYNKYIDKVNKNSTDVLEDYNAILNVYINNWFYDLMNGFKRRDFIDKRSNLKEKEVGDLLNPDFLDKTQPIIQLKKNYTFLKKTFSENGIRYVTHSVNNLGDTILKKAYIPKEKEQDNVENINIYYDKLQLDNNEIPTQEHLKKTFLKLSSKYHPDKHPDEIDKYTQLFQEINEAYKIILKYHYGTSQNHLYK